MKRYPVIVALLLATFGLIQNGWAQPWSYNFGTATGSFNKASAIDSTTFLPTPETNGGKARVRVGTQGGGFSMENQTLTFGSESYLRCVAPTGGSVNKFSVCNYTPGNAFTLRFRIRLGASDGSASVTAGTWYLLVGDSGSFSNNSGFTGSHCFFGMRWLMYGGGNISTRYRNGVSWSATGFDTTAFVQGHDHLVEIYGNNTYVDLPYTLNGGQSVAANTCDMWVDGTLVGNDLPKGQLSNLANIDSWMFYGENSASNASNLFVDDIVYTNAIAESQLPIQLASLQAFAFNGNCVTLTWKTVSEVNNYGFKVEKSANGTTFTEVANSFVAGNGTSNVPTTYTFTDSNAQPGTWYYRLRQIDLDGSVHYSDAVKVEILTGVVETTPTSFGLSQNYPNPFNPVTHVRYSVGIVSGQSPVASHVRLAVYDLLGREVALLIDEKKDPGAYGVTFDGSHLASGVYVCRLIAGDCVAARKMLLVR